MPLITDVTDRISDTRLVQLTNPRGSGKGATTDLALLAKAVADVEGQFKVCVGVLYDSADDRHVAPGVIGVMVALELYKGTSKAQTRWEEWCERLMKFLRMVTANDRIRPKSTSILQPTRLQGPGPHRPLFDPNSGFLDLIPAGPERGGTRFPWTDPRL